MSPERTVFFEAASTIAVVVASHEPLVYLSADQTVIAVSATFCRAFNIDPASAPGRPLRALGQGEWAMPQLASLLDATATGAAQIEAYEIELKRPDQPVRNLLLNVRKLEDGDTRRIRMLLAVTDVTEARTAARLKLEAQHRVANSLQIIASILMQSARQVQSDEARGYLQNAHHRVMSIATLQRQLSVLDDSRVALRPYLVQLCTSLGASMIGDPDRLSIKVTVDDSVVEPGVSVSLGLIVTELVINALKHAFPDQARGVIQVVYAATNDTWTLSVTDNGIGMPSGPDAPKPGLGTGIVEALSGTLNAGIEIRDAAPGTSVTIRHGGKTAV